MTNTNTIYKITNLINGKVYIGQTWSTLAHRWQQHYSPSEKGCVKLNRAIAKYGKENFSNETLALCSSQSVADYLEILYIKDYDSCKGGYNIKSGGQSGGKHSPETIERIRQSNLGQKRSAETRRKVSAAQTGRIQSAETIAKRVATQIGRKRSAEAKANMSVAAKRRCAEGKHNRWKPCQALLAPTPPPGPQDASTGLPGAASGLPGAPAPAPSAPVDPTMAPLSPLPSLK